VPLEDRVATHLPAWWTAMARYGGVLYGRWVKAALKSLFWYRPSMLRPADRPETWADLESLVKTQRSRGTTPLAIGAADGWVLTDWFENVLAAVGGDSYESLATPGASWNIPPVRQSLSLLAELWSVPGIFAGGPRRALLTTFDGSVAEVFGARRAAMLYEGDFVAQIIDDLVPRTEKPGIFRFPRIGSVQPQIVGGDMVVLLRNSTAGRDLMRYLASPESMTAWVRRGFLVPDTRIRSWQYHSAQSRQLAEELADPHTERHFDLSDRLTGGLSGDDGKGTWRILQDFFRSVTAGANTRDRSDAVNHAVAALDQAAREQA
jgi:ABC-type glycerol-3-phosphate transport system substrate-binding protein